MGSTSELLLGKRKRLRWPLKQYICSNSVQSFNLKSDFIKWQIQSYMCTGQVDGEQLLDLDMKKFRQEKQEV